ncbi:histone H1-like [Morone saxatilis]|uniref:histone H1-like n=1 Tax=Morone saxatilis TaxID=34816 RepID=UPI0015E1F8EF|nr:histone H1-like [Morone saxatilis]
MAEDSKKTKIPTRDLILKAVSACTDRKGLSFCALRKALAAEGYDTETYNAVHLKRSVKSLLEKGQLVQVAGRGVSGSFKAADKIKKKVKKEADNTKQPAATTRPQTAKTQPVKEESEDSD